MIKAYKSQASFLDLSLREFANPPAWPYSPSWSNNAEWAGAAGQKEASRYITNGWSEGAQRISELKGLIANPPAPVSRKRVGRWADTGDSLHIDRALRGEWDTAFRTSRRVFTQGPQVVDLYATIGGSCARSGEELFWAGAAAAVACDVLESAGYSVRLTGSLICAGDQNSSMGCRLDVLIKEAGDALAIDTAAFVLSHKAALRVLAFSYLHDMPGCGDKCGYWPQEYINRASNALKTEGLYFPEGSITIGQVFNRTDAINAIQEIIANVQGE